MFPGRTQLAIPGPSVIPDRVLAAMHRPSPNIYDGELPDMVATLTPDLKTVAQTTGEVAIYISNGHGTWEAALANTLLAGDRVLVVVTGRFGAGWADVARSMGIECDIVDFGKQAAADPQRIEEALRADLASGKTPYRAVLTVQTDTASSVINDIPAMRKAIDAAGHDALFMVDCIASLGCDEFHMDDWGVDVMMAGCQKGLMVPAGIGFVWFGPKAAEARKRAKPSFYWDWNPRSAPQLFYQRFAGTAPTHHLYGLRVALDMLVHEEGMEACWARHRTIASAVWAALDCWGEACMHHNIAERERRSVAVSAVTTAPGLAGKLRQWSEYEGGITLGIGLGMAEPDAPDYANYFRIGHMGWQNIPMTLAVLGTVDTGLKALGVEHGKGALEAVSAILAEANRQT